MKIQGRVLWFDQRDGNGVLVDGQGNEFYTDTSALSPGQPRHKLKWNVPVNFEINPAIRDTRCAYRVEIAATED